MFDVRMCSHSHITCSQIHAITQIYTSITSHTTNPNIHTFQSSNVLLKCDVVVSSAMHSPYINMYCILHINCGWGFCSQWTLLYSHYHRRARNIIVVIIITSYNRERSASVSACSVAAHYIQIFYIQKNEYIMASACCGDLIKNRYSNHGIERAFA